MSEAPILAPGAHNNYGMAPQDAARWADQLDQNPLLKQILVELDLQAVDTWRRSDTTSQREQAWHQQRTVRNFSAAIMSRIESMKMLQAAAEGRKRAAAQ